MFPGRLLAAYELGSHTEGSAASFSDIDGVIVFRGELGEERRRADAVLEACKRISPVRLNFTILDEEGARAMIREGDVRLKLGGRLVHGDDIRDRLELPPMAVYQEYMTIWPATFLPVLHDVDEVTYPLDYPDPDGEFFGYERKRAAR